MAAMFVLLIVENWKLWRWGGHSWRDVYTKFCNNPWIA